MADGLGGKVKVVVFVVDTSAFCLMAVAALLFATTSTSFGISHPDSCRVGSVSLDLKSFIVTKYRLKSTAVSHGL